MRKSGILLHISSLPSPYGIGSFGKEAYQFIDQLVKAGQKLWQILPLGQTGYGDSPYQSFSTYAGNPYFIDLETLIEEGLLTKAECDSIDFGSDPRKVNYEKLHLGRLTILKKAYKRANVGENIDFIHYMQSQAYWLDDYSLFMAVKDYFNGKGFHLWPEDIKLRHQYALNYYRELLYFEIEFYKFLQYLFSKQWYTLKSYANNKGIQIIGDIPIYVAYDSADTWSMPELFQLDNEHLPTAVAGCPPDGFAKEGQLWGNPLYQWDYHRHTGYHWWCSRIHYCFQLYDIVRIDHFRGFDEYYSIPYGSKTAIDGHWEKGPGIAVFDTIKYQMGYKTIIAEDLGYVTDSVRWLVNQSGFPGMKVLEFAFDSRDTGCATDYLPYNYIQNSIVYTGTHDNQTLMGWLEDINAQEMEIVLKYIGMEEEYATFLKNSEKNSSPIPIFKKITQKLIRLALSSVSDTCIIPMQDYLLQGREYRMNTPSTLGDNWKYRILKNEFHDDLAEQIAILCKTYGR